MQVSKLRVPAIVATGIICLSVGIGIGILWMGFFGYKTDLLARSRAPQARSAGEGRSERPRGPGAKYQLVALVEKLDLLSGKPLAVALSDSQKKTVGEQLQGLEALEELTEEEAKKRVDTLLETLKEHQPILVSAGYRLPGQNPFRSFSDKPNPFKDEKNAASLKSLQERLAASAPK